MLKTENFLWKKGQFHRQTVSCTITGFRD